MTIIRASSLPGYLDCPRRSAARMFRREIEDAGYTLRETPHGIGAAIGTATHTGAHHALRPVCEGHDLAPVDETEDAAIGDLHERVAEGAAFDKTSPDPSAAEKQVLRQLVTWRRDVAPQFIPEAVEQRLEAAITADVIASGQVDVADNGSTLRDLKTGTRQRANGAQYGLYSLIRRAHKHEVGRLVEDFVPRAPITKDQPPAISTEIDIADAEAAARATAMRIIADLEAFRASGDPWAFLANPASVLCSDKWCGAWGTPWCRSHRGARG